MAFDLAIDVENTPGALARVAAAVSDAGVNLAAATCMATGSGRSCTSSFLTPSRSGTRSRRRSWPSPASGRLRSSRSYRRVCSQTWLERSPTPASTSIRLHRHPQPRRIRRRRPRRVAGRSLAARAEPAVGRRRRGGRRVLGGSGWASRRAPWLPRRLQTWYRRCMSSARSSRGSSVRDRRRARERAIIQAARDLLDERGRRDASVDEIARAAGLSKALVYRAFDSKEEIFLLTLADYLAELRARGEEMDGAMTRPPLCARSASCMRTSAWSIRRSWTARWRSCSARRASSARTSQARYGCGSGAPWPAAWGRWNALSPPARRGECSQSTSRSCWPTGCVCRCSARCTSRARASACERSRVGGTFEIDDALVRDGCVHDALALAMMTEVSTA